MKIVRAQVNDESEVFYGVLEGGTVKRLVQAPYEDIKYDGREYETDKLKLLAPTAPSKIVCVGKNYFDHCEELKGEINDGSGIDDPILFIKPSTSVIGNGEAIKYPPDSERVDYEAELAIVIGKKAKSVENGQAMKYILGFTCLNDVTARDIQKREGQWSRAKSMDTFCPVGPWIETDMAADARRITARLNGEIKQDSNTSMMMHGIDEMICFITRNMTLLPGDIVATGTPAGIGPMQKGDTVEIEIEGIGILKNTVE